MIKDTSLIPDERLSQEIQQVRTIVIISDGWLAKLVLISEDILFPL
jgi:hypothetical protein